MSESFTCSSQQISKPKGYRTPSTSSYSDDSMGMLLTDPGFVFIISDLLEIL